LIAFLFKKKEKNLCTRLNLIGSGKAEKESFLSIYAFNPPRQLLPTAFPLLFTLNLVTFLRFFTIVINYFARDGKKFRFFGHNFTRFNEQQSKIKDYSLSKP
jgi:hypothetical protein